MNARRSSTGSEPGGIGSGAALLGVLLLGSLSGCAPSGFLFHHTREPLDINFDRTPARTARDTASGDIKHLTIRYALVFRADFLWASNAIGDIARAHGIHTVHYADIEKINVIGVWRQRRVHIYGEAWR